MDGEVSLQRSRAQMMMCPCAGTGHGWGQPTAASSAHPAPHRGSRQVAAAPAHPRPAGDGFTSLTRFGPKPGWGYIHTTWAPHRCGVSVSCPQALL